MTEPKLTPKLTKPQRELLESLPTTCADNYPPAVKLVALGLAQWKSHRFTDLLVRADQTHD